MALTTLAAVVAAVVLVPATALGHPGGPGKHRGDGPRLYTCERVEAKLTRLDARIARITERLEAGEARNPERAEKRLEHLGNRIERIQAKMTEENCASADGSSLL